MRQAGPRRKDATGNLLPCLDWRNSKQLVLAERHILVGGLRIYNGEMPQRRTIPVNLSGRSGKIGALCISRVQHLCNCSLAAGVSGWSLPERTGLEP
jgi:hypothetical protein